MTGLAPGGTPLPRKPTILVVDDTRDNLALMSNLLKGTYKVKIALTGEKALRIARSPDQPDLILLDIMMPGLDGFEVCQRLKGDPATALIPVIFLTGKSKLEDEQKGLELGAVDYITKPISPPILLARVRNHLALKTMADFMLVKNVELDNARAAAEKANRAKSDFLASMSHELRSPLNAILGFGQLMETETPPPTISQQESLTRILLAGWHLLKLIDEILDLAKVESGRVPLTREPVSLAEVLAECLDMVEAQAQSHEIRMIGPSLELAETVLADRTRLKQVLLNLLSNAIKYNSTGGSVEVSCQRTDQGATRVSIQDTGQGLAPEQLAQLFQAFNRLGQETGSEQGTGIGLVVAKRLIELMGGAIGVSSTVGVGTRFWIELAAVAAPLPCEPGPADLAQAVAVLRPPDCTLLYVEDNQASLELVRQIIARHPDLHLLTATNGPAALASARAFLPDLILMDINLPGPDGFEILDSLRAGQATAAIPVIAFSANAMPLEIERGLQAGFCQYLTKPFKVPAFMEAVDKALHGAKRPAEGELSHAGRC